MSGWAPVTLGDLGNWGSGGTPKKGTAGYYDGTIPWLKIGDLTDGLVDAAEDHITEKALAESSAKLVEPDTLLVAMYGSIGKLGIAGLRCATNQAIAHCRVDERLTSTRFLFWRLLAARSDLLSLGQGAGQPNISQTILRAFSVDLPPLAEQHRIVAKLDAVFEQTRAAKARLERLPDLLEKLKRSILAAAFRGDLTKDWRAAHPDVEPAAVLLDRIRAERRRRWEDGLRAKGKDPTKVTYEEPETTAASGDVPDRWAWASMGQAFVVQVGATPSRAEPSFWGGDIPWVSSGEVAFCRISSTKEQITTVGIENSSTRLQPAGTVLLGMIGEGKTRGQPAILDIAACTNQNSAAIRVSETEVSPEYVYYHLALQYEETRRIGSGNNQQALNKSRVEAMVLPLAPPDEQREIVRFLREAEQTMEALRARFARQVDLVESIERAALAKAFRGELVPQDPTDEPASVLLDRVRAARAAEPEGPKRVRGPRRDAAAVAEAANTVATNGHATNGHRDESLDLVVGVFQIDRRLTATAIAEATGLAAAAVKKALKILVDGGQVRVDGKARSAAYVWTA